MEVKKKYHWFILSLLLQIIYMFYLSKTQYLTSIFAGILIFIVFGLGIESADMKKLRELPNLTNRSERENIIFGFMLKGIFKRFFIALVITLILRINLETSITIALLAGSLGSFAYASIFLMENE